MINGRLAILFTCAVIGASGWLAACSKGKDATAPQTSLPAATRADIDKVVSAYELVREALAEDRADVRLQSATLADAAQASSEAAPQSLREPLEELSSAARQLAEIESGDLNAARSGFGQVSRALIAVLSAEPSLQRGRYVYECPMAKGYKKWVQVSEAVSNPYMGSEMLECGTEAEF